MDCQYLQPLYPEVSNSDNHTVEKREHRHLRMLELVDALYPGRGGIARMSRECGIDDSYLRRLTYSPSSRGSKGLGMM